LKLHPILFLNGSILANGAREMTSARGHAPHAGTRRTLSSNLRCFDTAFREMSNGAAMSVTLRAHFPPADPVASSTTIVIFMPP